MAKLTDKEKKFIIADYLDCQNYSEVAKKYKRSVDTIRRICLENEEVVNKLKQKKEQNTLDTIDYILSLSEKKQRILNKLLNAIELKADDYDNNIKQNAKDLATAYGIILDKDLKILEMKRGYGNNEQLTKVDELLAKINEEARNDIK